MPTIVQTLAYGLFAAWLDEADPTDFDWMDSAYRLRNSQYLWMGSRRPSFDSCSLITSLVSSFDPYVPQTVPA